MWRFAAKEGAKEVGDRPVWRRAIELERGALQDAHAQTHCPRSSLGDKPRLANTSLAGDQDGSALASLQLFNQAAESLDFPLASDRDGADHRVLRPERRACVHLREGHVDVAIVPRPARRAHYETIEQISVVSTEPSRPCEAKLASNERHESVPSSSGDSGRCRS